MNYCEYFSETLKELIANKGITIKYLSEVTGISLSRLYDFISEKRLPSLENAIKIAEFFHCSLDYLTGFTKEYTPCNFITVALPAERLKTAIDDCGKSRYAICKQMKTDQSQMAKWYNGQQTPSFNSLIKLAYTLDCSLDYLAGREKI